MYVNTQIYIVNILVHKRPKKNLYLVNRYKIYKNFIIKQAKILERKHIKISKINL